MSSVNRINVMSCLMSSPQNFFSPPLPLLKPSIANLLHLYRATVNLLFTCPQSRSPHLVFHRSHSHLVSDISFLILSLLVWSYIHHNIFISASFIFRTWEFLTDQHSYSILHHLFQLLLQMNCLFHSLLILLKKWLEDGVKDGWITNNTNS